MKNRVLVVDDCEANLDILEELLRIEYDVETAIDGDECLEKIISQSPDLVLLDVMMPGMDGREVCREIKSGPYGEATQVMLVSGQATVEERVKGYEVGADDYITKPFDHDELLAKVRVQFRLRNAMTQLQEANDRIQRFNTELENLVKERTDEVVATRDLAIFVLAKLAESRDPETGEHLDRMRTYSRILAETLRVEGPYTEQIDEKFVDNIYRSSPLHDIGKVGIPDAVLLKPGRLSKEEFEVMKRHTTIGAEALVGAVSLSSCGSFLDMAIDIARYHHERFNGSGYPASLVGQDIPLCARIVALADVYDALTSARVYKAAFDPEAARKMIEEEDGHHFDPAVMAAFRKSYDRFLDVLESGVPDKFAHTERYVTMR